MTQILHARTALLPDGWADDVVVTLVGGRIASTARGPAPAGAVPVGILLPAMSNLHSHTFQRAMAGMTERRSGARDSFWTWRDLMYRFLDRLSPDDVGAIAALAFAEMLEAGFGAVGEFHYLHHAPDGTAYADPAEMSARIAAAAAETGIGLTLLPVLYMQAGAAGQALTGGQRRFGCGRDGFAALLDAASRHLAAAGPDAALGVAPHSLRAVPPEALSWVADLRPDGPVHLHIAEQHAEVAEVRAALGASPVAWLMDTLGPAERWCLIHATHMTAGETIGLAASGAVAGLCPVTEANLGDGIFDGARFHGAGGRFGIGTDSNVRIGVVEELRALEYSQRLANQARAVIAAPDRSAGRVLYEAAASGGAQALGRDAGALRPGAWGDLLALDADDLALAGLRGDALLDAWIFAGSDRAVAHVWSAGRHVVRQGRHVGRGAIEARFRETLARLRADL